MDIATALAQVLLLATLTVGVVQVWKIVISDKNTQKVSVVVATFLALATGTSILQPLGFAQAINFVEFIPQLGIVYAILFWIADLGVTGFLASQGSNFIVDLFRKKIDQVRDVEVTVTTKKK